MAFSDWIPVNSSNLDAVAFNADTGTLQVRFQNGAVYEWYGVQEDVATALAEAQSPGRYLNAYIVGQYGKGQRL